MIDLSLTATQQSFVDASRESARRLFPRTELTEASRDNAPIDLGDQRWAQVAASGILGVAASKELGGLGMGIAEEVLLQLELGAQPSSGPIIATILAVHVAEAVDELELASDLIEGRTRATFVVNGRALDARQGNLALHVDENGATLSHIDAVEPDPSFDSTVSVATISSDAIRPSSHVDNKDILGRARLLVAGYLVGLAEAATETSVDYVKVREQFGKPIGAFQAVKHRCAEMAIRAYGARVELLVAAALSSTGVPRAAELEVPSAYLLAMRAAKQNADDNVQNHGGVGMTAESIPGVLVKRAHLYSRLVGSERSLVPLILNAPRMIGV
ncbi:acyl-CoA dehydrogenase family protein [Microbacterium sp. A93]|uniref:acyl-CoA dehydrogenase family protein n=1 Tax=Microbacterium sp. A93 TaxID=3450716 RepID=UPI003F41BA73